MRPVIDGLLDAIAPLGRADLVATVTSQYPVQVICGIVGVPLEDHERFAKWAEEINTGPLDPERGMAASQAMREYLEPLVEARRSDPPGDLLSELVHAEVDGERLTDERIYGFLRLLLPAGAETTFRVMGNALVALLTASRRARRRSRPIRDAARPGDRGDAAVGDVGDDGEPRRDADTEVARLPDRGGIPGQRASPGPPTATRTAGTTPTSGGIDRAAAAPPRVRDRSAPVPRDAPRAPRAPRRARRDHRPAAEPPARSDGTRADHRRLRVPWPRLAPGDLRRRATPARSPARPSSSLR